MDYKEVTGQASAWTRSYRMVISNPAEGIPSITFFEEQAIRIGEKLHLIPNDDPRGLRVEFSEAGQIPKLDFSTGEVIGVATHAELRNILYSLYLAAATQRDAEAGTIPVNPNPDPDRSVPILPPAPEPEPAPAPEPEPEPGFNPQPAPAPEPTPPTQP